MWNAATKSPVVKSQGVRRHIAAMTATAVIMTGMSLSSCSGRSEEQQASEMLIRAERLTEAGEYVMAKSVIDSIDSICPEAVEARRRGMLLMPVIHEGIINRQLTQTDSLIAVATVRGDSLSRYLEKVDNPIEPYFIVSGSREFRLMPRLMPDGTFYMLSVLPQAAPRIGHTSVTVSDGIDSATSATVGRDGERNAVTGGRETVHYIGEEIDSVASFIAARGGRKLTLQYNGAAGKTHTITLSERETEGIAHAYGYACNVVDLKVLHLKREALERQLQVARNQTAHLR